MEWLRVKTLNDVMHGAKDVVIRCLYTKNAARRLHRIGDGSGDVKLTSGDGEVLVLKGGTVLHFEPWVMDRGNITFDAVYKGVTTRLKLCGEGDLATYDGNGFDGQTYGIVPADEIRSAEKPSFMF